MQMKMLDILRPCKTAETATGTINLNGKSHSCGWVSTWRAAAGFEAGQRWRMEPHILVTTPLIPDCICIMAGCTGYKHPDVEAGCKQR